ncbi:energy transducer TonB family protein [Marinobacter bohaiensis]|uniref:energy transducer TonB family protein n=1 Tax=Marinobacter bohaiensis TaxID=2201898 RepID=UPI000DAF0E5B|nr:energy transducer TonB [Marinobacter bohaiensis]
MPLPGPSNAQPVHFRLAIALLLALLVHSAGLIALVHSLQHLTKPFPATAIHLRLTAPSHQESQHSATSAEQPAASPPSPAQPRQPDQPAPTTTPEPVVTSNPSDTAVPPHSQPEHAPSRSAEAATSTRHPAETPEPSAKTLARSAEASPSSTASQAQEAGTPVEAPPTTTENRPAQTHADPVAKDPYVALLWQRISTALSRRPVHSISELQQVRVVRLELQLMDNGTLIQLQTLESSGDPALDRAARQGALAASPYPVPPSSARDQDYRYQVELRFTPRRS